MKLSQKKNEPKDIKCLQVFAALFILFFLNYQAATQTKTIRLSKPEKRKIIQTLIEANKPVETEFPGKGKGIFIKFFDVPDDVIALLPKEIKNIKVIFLTEQDVEKKEGKKWAYYQIGPFNLYENRLVASISFNAYCYDNVQSFEFFRVNGKLRIRKVDDSVGECLTWESDNKAEDKEIYPVVKTKKPNE